MKKELEEINKELARLKEEYDLEINCGKMSESLTQGLVAVGYINPSEPFVVAWSEPVSVLKSRIEDAYVRLINGLVGELRKLDPKITVEKFL